MGSDGWGVFAWGTTTDLIVGETGVVEPFIFAPLRETILAPTRQTIYAPSQDELPETS